ncbi:MAG: M23 family metallopeptidase [Patescibacteria group bacterium]|jgi:murein DD-endopeptidase MepM/ murein hydrolase activator NlpD
MGNQTQNQYLYPVAMSDKVRMAYNESPAHVGKLKYAVDFIVAEGTPVKAAAAGVVVDLKADSDLGGEERKAEGLGNYIEIKHENEEYSEYEHLKLGGALVKVGDRVAAGQVIGYSGATGWLAQLGPHLHFMVGKYGATVEDYETLEIVWNYK